MAARAKRIAIVGYGVEGRSAYEYWTKLGCTVVVHDADTDLDLPAGALSVLGPDYLAKLDGYDLVVRSPGVKPWLIKTKAQVTSATREFFEHSPARIIGVTGTKGKGTTTTLIARILGEAGWRTWVGGNIGQVPLDFLAKVRANHLAILELSSFQLMDMDVSPHIAVCLMIAPEHMNWHRGMREYVAAKGNIFWHQRSEDLAVFKARDEYASQIAQLSPGTKLPYMETPGARVQNGRIVMDQADICAVDEVGLIGPHNLENICAAITATWALVKQNPDPVRRAVTAFTGLPHRLELVREFEGVRYFNDSFSTTPETAIAAIASFQEPKVVVLGGSEKNSDYEGLAWAVRDGGVRQAVLIGDTAPRIQAALAKVGFKKVILGTGRMPDLVATVRSLAEPGDVVLLSPACASFGLFKNYKDRGDQFKAAVRVLK